MTDAPYQALLLVSFGGPEGPDDVLPFLQNVLRGRNVPEERMLEVAEHYHHFGGVSPINQQCRQLISSLEKEFASQGCELPIYWGNRNWHPYLETTLREMKADGIQRALAFFTSAYSCYSGCRQYRENIAQAREQIGDGAPVIDKIRMPFNHPGFVEPLQQILGEVWNGIPSSDRGKTAVLFTAHSIPESMANNCRYVAQLQETARLVAEGVGIPAWELVFQSRSGPPQQPWLEPDVCQRIEELASQGELTEVVVQPIGFLSDHMEVMFDLDYEAKSVCEARGLRFHRAGTLGHHPQFVSMIRELVEERLHGVPKRYLGQMGPSHDVCPTDCCLYTPTGRPTRA